MHDQLLIVQNIAHEGAGLLQDLLHEHNIGFELHDLSQGGMLPDPRQFAGMVVLGGPQSANDTTVQIRHETQCIGDALETGIPILGICLGLQLMVKAGGGRVVPCPVKETGFHEPDGEPYTVRLTTEGRHDRLFAGLPEQLRVFQLHGETVVPDEGMALLATGRGCPAQVVRIGRNAWGLQCHFELTRPMLERWTHLDHDLASMDRAALLAEFDSIHDEYTRTGRTILSNFLEACGLAR